MRIIPLLGVLALMAGCSTPTATPPAPPAAPHGSSVPPENQAALADLRDQQERIRIWAVDTALTTLAGNARTADAKFAGVRSMAELLARQNYKQPLDVEALTFRNPDYWRGLTEMAPGNHLVAAMPVFLFAANGDFDQAERLLKIIWPFSQPHSVADDLLVPFWDKLKAYDALFKQEMQRGIALHDHGEYQDAIAVFQSLLAVCPDNAWARYELFYSTLMASGKETVAEEIKTGRMWTAAAHDIYRADPLYTFQFSGQRGKTMAALHDRLALRILDSRPPADPKGFFEEYADLALKLEAYGYAANIYWLMMPVKSKMSTDEKIARFLYCLKKLGVPGLKENFKGDFAAAFARLDGELTAHRTE